MPDELQVQVPGSDNLALETKRALHQKITEFSQSLFREAQRLEAINRTHGGSAQITATDVSDANAYVRRGIARSQKDTTAALLNVGATTAGIAVGIFTNNIDQSWGVIGLVLAATLMVGFGVVGYMR
ncbi:hypothetical protein OG266_22740 [Streptomyces sp. NBC_00554]|uniref:hypothetical protein n=1 Tax=Streptomyces sp. NBC_00554 TaxID=2903661 RepID=UPI00352F5751|nr:hypothetical protein OG266_22740 [Streptomyces sp. NBC_00554]